MGRNDNGDNRQGRREQGTYRASHGSLESGRHARAAHKNAVDTACSVVARSARVRRRPWKRTNSFSHAARRLGCFALCAWGEAFRSYEGANGSVHPEMIRQHFCANRCTGSLCGQCLLEYNAPAHHLTPCFCGPTRPKKAHCTKPEAFVAWVRLTATQPVMFWAAPAMEVVPTGHCGGKTDVEQCQETVKWLEPAPKSATSQGVALLRRHLDGSHVLLVASASRHHAALFGRSTE